MSKSQRLIRLDTWKILREISSALSKRTRLKVEFVIEDHCITLCKGEQRRGVTGTLALLIDWPNKTEDRPKGLIVVSHPSWGCPARIVPLVGSPIDYNAPVW